MRAADQFHVGIVVDDFEATLSVLSELFGYEWGEEIRASVPVQLATGELTIDLGFVYSLTVPRLEIIRSIPGTLWTEAPGSTLHHLGYWSDDVEADSDPVGGTGPRKGSGWVRPRRNPVLGLPQTGQRTTHRDRQPRHRAALPELLGDGTDRLDTEVAESQQLEGVSKLTDAEMTPSWHASQRPQAPAIIMGSSGETVTYAELDDRSRRLASALRGRGIAPGDHIAILMENDARFLEVCLGGATFRPLLHGHQQSSAPGRDPVHPRRLRRGRAHHV